MSKKNTNLHLTVLDEVQHGRTCGYWYVVTAHASPHTAFATERGLRRWMDERDLTLSKPLTAPGTWSTQDLFGSYVEEMHWDEAEFSALPAVIETRDLSNGNYVVARITEDKNGMRTVHTLNPNVKTRQVFDYAESRAMMN